MRVYLVQHGQAKTKDQDPERPLTQEGTMDVRRMAAFLKPLELSVGAIWHSDMLRAAETAEFLAKGFKSSGDPVERPGMRPDDDVGPILDAIARAEGDLVLIGHMPHLAKLAARLLTGSEATQPVAFRNAGVVCLQKADDGAWQVVWDLTPEVV